MKFSFLNFLFSMVFFATCYEGEGGEGGGSGAGAGAAGGEGGQGGGQGTAATDGAGGAGGQGTAATDGAGGEKPFWESLQDENLRTFAQTKNWQSPESAVKSAYNAEKLIGAPADELVRVPKDAGMDAFKQVASKFGVPESADKYELPTIDGVPTDEGYMNHMKNVFHEMGLPAEVAKQLAAKNNEYVQQVMEQQSQDYEAATAAAEKELQREWGNGYQRQMDLAQNAAKQLGFDGKAIDALESTMGYDGVMKFMADLGAKLGEDNFVSGEMESKGFHGQMTPAEAKQAYASMVSDPEQMKALRDKAHPNHKTILEKKSNLFKIMHPDE